MSLDHVRTLREAAHSMREEHGASHPRHEMWFRFAALLSNEADAAQRGVPSENHAGLMEVALSYLAARTLHGEHPDISSEL